MTLPLSPTSPARGALPLLGFANFVVGAGAFVVVGVLTPVSQAFGVSQAAAGWLMTAYAIFYAIASPVSVALTGRVDRRSLMVAGLAVFGLGALACALAPDFATLLAARMLMALGAGVVTPVAASIAAALAAPEARGKALATVFMGLTIAQVIGVPAGAWLGYALGWQATFVAIAVLTGAGVALLWARLPSGLVTPPVGLRALGSVLATPKLVAAVAFTALFVGGLYVVYTYLAPFLEARHGFGRDGVTAMLALFGLGAVIGNTMGGWLTDRIGSERALRLFCAAQLVLMPLLTLLPLPVAGTAIVMLVWSVFGWCFMVAQQARLAALDPPRTPLLFALNASAIYVGGSLRAFAGGLVLAGGGTAVLGLAGAVLAMLAFGSLVLVRRM